MASDLAATAAEFIKQYEWNWWVSLTFRGTPSHGLGDKLFHCWMNKLNRKTFGSHYYRRAEGLRWIRGTELQERNVVHFHALIAGDPKPTIAEASAYWAAMAGGAEIRVYDPFRGAAYYSVKKYATDGNMDLGGRWPCFPPKLDGVVSRPPQ